MFIKIKTVLLAVLLCGLWPSPLKAAGQQGVPAEALFALAEEVVERALDKSGGAEYRLERLTRLPETIYLPVGSLETEPELVGNLRYNAPVQVRIALKVNGAVEMNLLTVWRVRKFAEVAVAARDISSRSVLSSADARLEKRELTRPEEAIFSLEEIAGLEIKRSLTQGNIISRSMLTSPQLIRAGDNVTIVSRSGTVVAQAAGQALQGGAAGDLIRVRNLGTGKTILARIEDVATVVAAGAGQ
jgi:flagella basal body P-ring formation protein FlgA